MAESPGGRSRVRGNFLSSRQKQARTVPSTLTPMLRFMAVFLGDKWRCPRLAG